MSIITLEKIKHGARETLLDVGAVAMGLGLFAAGAVALWAVLAFPLLLVPLGLVGLLILIDRI